MLAACFRRRALLTLVGAGAAVLAFSGCASTGGAGRGKTGYTERGLASWYGPDFHGRRAANGEIYDMYELTAAHRTLPFETTVEVRNRENGRRVEVRITDRGPFVRGRIIDLSYEAARQLDMVVDGIAPVEIRVLRSAPDADLGRGYWVQAGAFREVEAARELRRRIARQFGDVQLTPAGDWFRVRLGPFAKRKKAEATREKLRKQGIDAFVVRL